MEFVIISPEVVAWKSAEEIERNDIVSVAIYIPCVRSKTTVVDWCDSALNE